MTSNGYQLISADSHVVEPRDLFEQGLPAGLRDRAPRLESVDGGDAWIVEVPGGFSGPYRVLLTGVADGAFTVAITGRVGGRPVYTRRWTGTIARGQRLGGGLTQDFDVRYTYQANVVEAFTGYLSPLRSIDDPALASVLLSPLEVAATERR